MSTLYGSPQILLIYYYIQKDNTKAETITFHTLNNSNSYLHFGKLPQSGVYLIQVPHCISDVSELIGFGLFLNMLFSIVCLSAAFKRASLYFPQPFGSSYSWARLPACFHLFFCFSTPPLLSTMLHKLFWGGILFLGWMHSCAPYKSPPECEQTYHETACKECTYKKACFIDEPFLRHPQRLWFWFFMLKLRGLFWLIFADAGRQTVALRPSVLLRHTLINSP